MPITIPDHSPVAAILESENVFAIQTNRALHQDIRPLEIVVLNLMPNKVETEVQLLRLLSNTPLQINITLLQVITHDSKNTSREYLLEFYRTFDEVKSRKFDGMIITGAPIEQMPFEEVDYWKEISEIMEWTKNNIYSTLHICWGAQAGLYYHYGIPKYDFDEKLSGIYLHTLAKDKHFLMRGFDEDFYIPHSRHTGIHAEDIKKCSQLQIVADSEEAGPAIIVAKGARQVFITGHCEYDRDTLAKEYERDLNKGLHPQLPKNYFTDDDASKPPRMIWRAHANILTANWVNFVYQQTPYNIEEVGMIE